jgi:hypothetical protein
MNRARRTAVLALVLVACSDTPRARDHDAGEGDAQVQAQASHKDAAIRVEPRTVAIELPAIGWQSFGPKAGGKFDYGTIEPLDGVQACVTMRRDVFATFQQFSPLPKSICVTNEAGKVVRIEGVPAYSDLIVTITKEGFLPGSVTHRVEGLDVPVPSWGTSGLYILLVKAGQEDPWIDAPKRPAADALPVVAQVFNGWSGPATAHVSGTVMLGLSAVVPTVASATGASVTITREGDATDAPITLSTSADRPRFVALTGGLYRVQVTHPRAMGCEAWGWESHFSVYGFTADGPGVVELPVLAGHATAAVVQCFCAPSRAGEDVADLASCTFESKDGGT